MLPGVDVRAIGEATGKEAGALLARAGGDDVIDAAVALLAVDGDEIVTSGPADLRPLAVAAGLHVDIVPV